MRHTRGPMGPTINRNRYRSSVPADGRGATSVPPRKMPVGADPYEVGEGKNDTAAQMETSRLSGAGNPLRGPAQIWFFLMSDGKFKSGADWKGNAAGRPKGIIDKRQRLQQTIRDSIESVIPKLQEQALEGDTSAAALLLSRGIAPLRAESGERVEFDFDPSKPVADQLVQVASAVASGQLTIDQGKQFAEILQRIAAVRALSQGGDQQEALIQAFKDMAQRMPDRRTSHDRHQ